MFSVLIFSVTGFSVLGFSLKHFPRKLGTGWRVAGLGSLWCIIDLAPYINSLRGKDDEYIRATEEGKFPISLASQRQSYY
jgi:hypothetical protein